LGHQIKFKPSGRLCEGEVGESILAASLRVGLNPVYGCSNGNCGACKAKLISGEIEPTRHHDFGLTDAEKTSGHFLMCANRALSDVEVQADVTQGPDDIPLQDIETKVKAVEYLDSQVIKLHLQTPRSHRLRFISGQSVTLTFRDDIQMNLPIASCPCDDRNIHFHVPDIPGDAFSEMVFSGDLTGRDSVHLQGPKPGKFFLDDTETRKNLILCWHTGFAPIASLIEHAISLEIEADIFLHRFSPTPDRQYLSNLCRSWSDAFDNIHAEMMPDRVTLLTSAADCAQILKPIAARYPDLSNFNIYLAGPPNFVGAARNMFAELGVHASQLKTHIDDLVALD
jgi:CDP-4-dehydro-6-deoxyglucose reductase